MSNATKVDDFGFEGDCPLCLSPLPPMWEINGFTRMPCCGKVICESCVDEKHDYLSKNADGFHLKPQSEQDQLKSVCFHCPFCRAEQDPKKIGDVLLKKSREGCGWADYCLQAHCRISAPEFGKRQDLHKARKHLRMAAARGYPLALSDLGDYYSGRRRNDLGITPSPLEARKNYLGAAKRGHAEARFRLAHSYLSEKHDGFAPEGEQDVDTAIELLQQAADEGYIDSYFVLGNLHFPGEGEKDDIDASLSYYRKGVEIREVGSLCRLATVCSHHPQYFPNNALDQTGDELMNLINEDPTTAAMALFELAARQGDSYGQRGLANCLSEKLIMGHCAKIFVAATSWNSVARYNSVPSGEAAKELRDPATKDVGGLFCFNCLASPAPERGRRKFTGCSRCQAAWYCGKKCQVEHWKKGHKNICGGHKVAEWTRDDALTRTLDPFCVGAEPPPGNGQLSHYFSQIFHFYGTDVQEERVTSEQALDEAKQHRNCHGGA